MDHATGEFGGCPAADTLSRAADLVKGFVDRPLWSASDAQVAEVIAAASALEAQIAAVRLQAVREADSRGMAGRVGAASTQTWLRRRMKVTPAEATRQVTLAAALDRGLDATRLALAHGQISVSHAQVIARAVTDLPDEDPGAPAMRDSRDMCGASPGSNDMGDNGMGDNGMGDSDMGSVREMAEARLLQWARQFDPAQLAKLGKRILDVVDPDAADVDEARRLAAEEKRARQRRQLTFTDDGHGTTWVRGRLDAESATVVKRALDPLARPRPSDAGLRDARTPAARTADALVEVCRRTLQRSDLPAQRGEKPQLVITMDYAKLRDAVGAGVTDTGERLSPATVRRIACNAQVIPAVLGSASVPLDLGRTQRLFTATQRRALILRDRGCAFPGCDRPPQWCEAHHVTHWINGGVTEITNGVLLCGHHHRVVHKDEWQVRITEDGFPEFTPPAIVDPHRRPIRNDMHGHHHPRHTERHASRNHAA